MQTTSPSSDLRQFGVFQLDLKAGELYKSGARVKLQDQPFRVLALLVERAGQVVTREDLRQRVWPSNVYVDFDQGLNNAIKKVREALGDSADSPTLIETVARHGYRFIAPVTAPPGYRAGTRPKPETHTLRRGILIGSAAALLAALGVWAWHESATRGTAPLTTVTLAVLPFDNLSGDPEQEFFSDGMTEEMIAQLGKLNPERLIVMAPGTVAKYKHSSLAVNEIGRELHADYIVQGSVRRVPDRVRITVHLIQVPEQTDRWAESYDRDVKDILALQDSLARTIADQINIKLAPVGPARRAARSVDPDAYEAYLKGRYYWNKRTAAGMQKAEAYFQQAIDKDPAYGAAYSGLADCNSGLTWHGFTSPAETLPRAKAAALKAIEIDPQSAEAHASLGLVLHHEWDWSGAEAEFKRALQLDPRYANAHHWYGDYLSVRGRHEEALVEAKKASDLDPLNLMIGTWLGLRYYLARNYDRAAEQGRSTVELDQNFAAAHLLLGETYVQMRLHEQGLAELESAASLSGDSPLYLAQTAVAYAAQGRKTEALRIAAQLQAASLNRYVSPYGLAQIYAALNDKEQTFKWLENAYVDHSVWMTYLAVDPVLDGYRSDQRFQDLLRRVRLL